MCIKNGNLRVRNQYCPFVVIDYSAMADNFDCATFIFSSVLFSVFAWLFAIIIIFRHLPRENHAACVPLLHTSTVSHRHGEWIMRKMDGKSAWGEVESPQAILPSIMTAEIARNRKTNRVDYRRDSVVALFHLLRIFFFFSRILRAVLLDNTTTPSAL